MIRFVVKGVRGHLLRFLLTAFAVSLGVSLVAGTFVLTDAIDGTFSSLVDKTSSNVDVVVRGKVVNKISEETGTEIRAQMPDSFAQKLAAVPGVVRAKPAYTGIAVIVGKNGEPVRGNGPPALGLALLPGDRVPALVSGRAPQGPNEVAVDSATLKKSGLKLGDHTMALLGAAPRPVTLVGEYTYHTPLGGARITFVDEATGRQLWSPNGMVDQFGLQAAPGISDDEVAARVRAVLPSDAEALTEAQYSADQKSLFRKGFSAISVLLLIFAGVSVLVGAFIIANTFLMLVAQRTRELALLRALGASRAQVVRAVLGEAAVMGIVGAGIGLGVGVLLARGLKALFTTWLGMDMTDALPVATRTVVVSMSVGVIVTVVASTWPAVRASRLAPVAALRDDLTPTSASLVRRGVSGVVLVLLGATSLTSAVTRHNVAWSQVGFAALVCLAGVVVIGPAAARPVVRLLGVPFVLFGGVVGRLARENALRNPRRTSLTASALMIGLSLVTGFSVLGDSMKASVASLIEKEFTGNYVLNGGQAGFSANVAGAVTRVPGVRSEAILAVAEVTVDGKHYQTIASSGQGLAENLAITMDQGSLQALDLGKVLVSRDAAKTHHWTVGSVLDAGIGTLKGEKLVVGGIVGKSQILREPLIIPHTLYNRAIPPAQQGAAAVLIKAVPGVDLAQLRKDLVAAVKPYIVVSVQDARQYQDSQNSQVDTMLAIFDVLLALSIVIAFLGILNTLALSVFERTREIGLLRAVGLGRAQLSRMITMEAVATTLFGAALGTALGVGLGIATQHGLASEGLHTLSIPWAQLVVIFVVAGLVGVIAAILPAIRAVRLDVLKAITTD